MWHCYGVWHCYDLWHCYDWRAVCILHALVMASLWCSISWWYTVKVMADGTWLHDWLLKCWKLTSCYCSISNWGYMCDGFGVVISTQEVQDHPTMQSIAWVSIGAAGMTSPRPSFWLYLLVLLWCRDFVCCKAAWMVDWLSYHRENCWYCTWYGLCILRHGIWAYNDYPGW